MRRARAIVTMILAALLWVVTPRATGAEPAKGGVGQSSKSADHGRERGRAHTNPQWAADPERGWVRAGERHRAQEPSGSAQRRGPVGEGGRGKAKKL